VGFLTAPLPCIRLQWLQTAQEDARDRGAPEAGAVLADFGSDALPDKPLLTLRAISMLLPSRKQTPLANRKLCKSISYTMMSCGRQ
jgi:hypothetical protein